MNYKNIGLGVFVLLALLLSGCGSNASNGSANSSGSQPSQSPCDKPSSIRGSIVSITPNPAASSANSPGIIFIDGSKEQHAAYDKAYISLAANTQVFEKQGQACHTVSAAALKVGQRVQVQPGTGIAIQTYPPQLDASEIVILSSGN